MAIEYLIFWKSCLIGKWKTEMQDYQHVL